jgi:sulfate permease, SulP family
MPRRSLARLYKDEFTGYSLAKFQQDLLAGLTVAAVALAFGFASGASAAAGLVTAILAGVIMGLLTGAPFQINGPTGAMSAVLGIHILAMKIYVTRKISLTLIERNAIMILGSKSILR